MRLEPSGARIIGSARSHPRTLTRVSHLRRRDSVARPEKNLFPRAAVLAQRDFAIGAAIDVIEDGARKAAPRELPQIVDIYRALNQIIQTDLTQKRAERFRAPPLM